MYIRFGAQAKHTVPRNTKGAAVETMGAFQRSLAYDDRDGDNAGVRWRAVCAEGEPWARWERRGYVRRALGMIGEPWVRREPCARWESREYDGRAVHDHGRAVGTMEEP